MTNADNARTFQLQLDQFADVLISEALVAAHAKVTLDLLYLLIKKSPVGYPPNWKHPAPKGYVGGQFRSCWQASTSGAATVPAGTNDRSRYGDEPSSRQVQDGNAALRGLAPYSVTYIVNGLPYGERLNSGWSTQAPAGFVELSIAEAKNASESELRKFVEGENA